MKKVNRVKVCNILCVLLSLAFIIKTVVDYIQYSNALNSAPFYFWILANSIYFIIPAVIVFIIGIAIINKTKTDK